MSHSLNVVRIAAVCCAITSCCAILRRSGDIFLRMNRPSAFAEATADKSADGSASRASEFPLQICRVLPPRRTRRLCQAAALAGAGIFSGSSFSSSTMRRTAGERDVSLSAARFFRLATVFFSGSGSFFFSSDALSFFRLLAFFASGTFFSPRLL